MLTQSFTHKSHKITTLTTDSYKQLFVLITMLLTVLSVQPSTFTMAAPLQQPQQYQLKQSQLQQHNLPYKNVDDTQHYHTQLHENLLAEKVHKRYDHHYLQQQHQQQRQQKLQHQQLGTDLTGKGENENGGDSDDEEERVHKREITWHDYYNSIMQSQAINWYNPCGGFLNMDVKPVKRKRPPPIKKELRKLQNTIAKNYNSIKETLHTINTRNMKQWDLTEKYSFLPKLNNNSSISLRRWHRQFQIYVAAFEYLRRAQLHFDYVRDSQESPIARELNDLMKHARLLLCNIEHAINNTTTRKRTSNIDSLFINRSRMEQILKFSTNIKYVSPLRWHQIKTDDKNWIVNEFDLRFSKSYYYDFVRKLITILRMHTKRPGPIYLGKNANKQQQQNRQQQKKSQNQAATKIRHSRKNSNKY